jgi:transcriptional regulator with XRE-family HTH domain
VNYKRFEKDISRAIGAELRTARETMDWSRMEFVLELPSGIGDRTLLSYEHGTRHLTVVRLIELCHLLGISAPKLLADALQRARTELANLDLRVDVKALLKNKNEKFRPMHQWAQNTLNECPGGIVSLPPSAVKELATFMGHTQNELSNYLAKFIPDENDGDANSNKSDTTKSGKTKSG